MGLTPDEVQEFKTLLQNKIEKLVSDTIETKGGMNTSSSLFADPLDRAALESNRNFTLRLRDRERKLLDKVREAIGRIENGTFGLCEECEEPIEKERLLSRPVTTLCIDCKEEQERIEKMEL